MIPTHLADCVEFTAYHTPETMPAPVEFVESVKRVRPLKGRPVERRDKYRIPRKPGDTVDIYPDDDRSDEE